MKLTSKQEEEILELYHHYWDSTLKGDIKTFISYLDDNAIIYGSAAGETFTTKKEAAAFYESAFYQVTGKLDFRNRQIGVRSAGGTVVVFEKSDLYVLIDQTWNYYGPARITDTLVKEGNHWKIICHHASFPDSRTEDGDILGIDQVKKENIQLREAVKRRTVELEEKNRQLEMEAALERARSRIMGMQRSEELNGAVSDLFKEIETLGIHPWSCGYHIFDNDEEAVTQHMRSADGGISPPFKTPLTADPIFQNIHKARQQKQVLIVIESDSETQAGIYRDIFGITGFGENPGDTQTIVEIPRNLVIHCAYFSQGYLVFITNQQVPETHEIFKRFAKVFDQGYTHFLDLQRSEVLTRQANIETALEKVRARALAMQQPEELTEVAEVMRYEMGLLGVEELETSSIYIHEENSDVAECWYAIKDIRVPGKKLVADHFVLNLQDTWVGRQMFDFYRSSNKQVSIPMQGANRKEWINYCSERSSLLVGFYGDVIPERTYHLYKFSNGTIGAATPGNISAESWDLLQRAASVFSLAYSRFRDLTQARTDLQRLKEEKQRAESALAELQTTQKQLIHAEKMASLGVLTAGVAHEIQNPLNFVKNFAEVNTELSAELRDALKRGDLGDAEDVLAMVADNEQKILHHSQRADAIVKSMLQHSRSGGGVKEATDINALADEYLRLAYHGWKAKDRSFNCSIKTDLDQSIGKINIIPQDISRALLNLLNNAFYAIDERKKQIGDGYDPEVTVTTKRLSATENPSIRQSTNSLIISVRDNGTGIPDAIKDKIFQPFFTTKPTGEGAGLGLSLSYDIVQAHGGELTMESTEGEGATFEISIPLN